MIVFAPIQTNLALNNKLTPPWIKWFIELVAEVNGSGRFTGTIATAPLTGGGSAGSMTFTNGYLTSHTDAT